MTDQMIPADKVREIADWMRSSLHRAANTCRDAEFLGDMSVCMAELNLLLPPRPLPQRLRHLRLLRPLRRPKSRQLLSRPRRAAVTACEGLQEKLKGP